MADYILLNSGLPINSNNGSVAGAGSGTVSSMNNLGFHKLTGPVIPAYPKVQTGVAKSVSAGTFAANTDDPINFLSVSLADTANTGLAHGVMEVVSPNMAQQYTRRDITSMSVSGVPTFGGMNGSGVLVSGQNGVTGKTADQTLVGEFNYTINGNAVVNADY